MSRVKPLQSLSLCSVSLSIVFLSLFVKEDVKHINRWATASSAYIYAYIQYRLKKDIIISFQLSKLSIILVLSVTGLQQNKDLLLLRRANMNSLEERCALMHSRNCTKPQPLTACHKKPWLLQGVPVTPSPPLPQGRTCSLCPYNWMEKKVFSYVRVQPSGSWSDPENSSSNPYEVGPSCSV